MGEGGEILSRCCDALRHVRRCGLKFENGQMFHATFVDVACCTRLVRQSMRTSSICNTQHVAGGWPNARNRLRPIMLHRNVAIVWSGLYTETATNYINAHPCCTRF